MEKAYLADEAVRWREALNRDFVMKQIREKREQVEWAKSDLYPHPLVFIPRKKKPSSLIEKLRCLLP